MWDLVQGLRTSGTTIVLTTHYMEEAERLADRIAVIAEGQIVAEGTPGSLGPRNLMAAEISFTVSSGVRLQQLPVGLGVTGIDDNGKARVRCEDPVPAMFSLTRWALKNDHQLPDLELRRATLEDVYLHLTCVRAPAGARLTQWSHGCLCPGAVARGAGSGPEIVAPPHESSSGRRRCDARSSPVLRAGQSCAQRNEGSYWSHGHRKLLMRSASLSSMRSTPRSVASPTRAANTRPNRGLLPGD